MCPVPNFIFKITTTNNTEAQAKAGLGSNALLLERRIWRLNFCSIYCNVNFGIWSKFSSFAVSHSPLNKRQVKLPWYRMMKKPTSKWYCFRKSKSKGLFSNFFDTYRSQIVTLKMDRYFQQDDGTAVRELFVLGDLS